MWIDFEKIMSSNKLFTLINGERGNGKTTGCLLYFIKRWINDNDYKMLWVRRTEADLEDIISTFFDDIVRKNFFPGHTFETRGHIGLIDGNEALYFKSVSVGHKRRGFTTPDIRLVCYDEFLCNDRDYLKDEVEHFLSLYDTVARPYDPDRKRTRVVMLSNVYSVINPYYKYFNIKLNNKGAFKNDFVYALQTNSVEYKEHAETTEFGRFIKETNYYKNSIQNEFKDDFSDVEKRPPNTKYLGMIESTIPIGVWIDYNAGTVWMATKFDKNNPVKFKVNNNYLFIKSSPLYIIINEAFRKGAVRYETLEIKKEWFDIYPKIKY